MQSPTCSGGNSWQLFVARAQRSCMIWSHCEPRVAPPPPLALHPTASHASHAATPTIPRITPLDST
jgi:hypothetical protein